jgi:hypothetical protein
VAEQISNGRLVLYDEYLRSIAHESTPNGCISGTSLTRRNRQWNQRSSVRLVLPDVQLIDKP